MHWSLKRPACWSSRWRLPVRKLDCDWRTLALFGLFISARLQGVANEFSFRVAISFSTLSKLTIYGISGLLERDKFPLSKKSNPIIWLKCKHTAPSLTAAYQHIKHYFDHWILLKKNGFLVCKLNLGLECRAKTLIHRRGKRQAKCGFPRCKF